MFHMTPKHNLGVFCYFTDDKSTFFKIWRLLLTNVILLIVKEFLNKIAGNTYLWGHTQTLDRHQPFKPVDFYANFTKTYLNGFKSYKHDQVIKRYRFIQRDTLVHTKSTCVRLRALKAHMSKAKNEILGLWQCKEYGYFVLFLSIIIRG